MNKGIIRFFSILVLATLILSGCSTGAGNTIKAESTGGNWATILLASPDAIRLAVPPAAKSADEQKEIDELIEFQKQRTDDTQRTVDFWNAGASVRWNEIARDLVAKHRTDPPSASRLYALLSVAQYDALVVAWNNKYFHNRQAPDQISGEIKTLVPDLDDPVYPSEHAVVAAASAAVLGSFYPDEADFLDGKRKEDEESRLWAGVNYRSDITAGDSLGDQVAQTVLAYAKTDGADASWTGGIPTGAGLWFSAPDDTPLLPMWGKVRPWLMTSGDEFRPAAPPAYDSAEFTSALAEVRNISDTRTSDQSRIAAIWADNLGTYTPPGHWNAIAAKLIQEHKFNEIRAARALALMNMALMDAGISCWDAKFHYWLIRPWQVDPDITTPVGQPNFPSYTSGHATFSGAAAEVLGYLFPDQKDKLDTMAEEAALSRLYGGIHYSFDNEVGLEEGRAVGKLAVKLGESDGAP